MIERFVTRWLRKHRGKYLLRSECRRKGYFHFERRNNQLNEWLRLANDRAQELQERVDKAEAEAAYYEGLYRRALVEVVACEKEAAR